MLQQVASEIRVTKSTLMRCSSAPDMATPRRRDRIEEAINRPSDVHDVGATRMTGKGRPKMPAVVPSLELPETAQILFGAVREVD